MGLHIRRWLETRRAPKRRDGFGGHYTPSGIDIYTTDDPELVRLSNYDSYGVRVAELLDVLDELDRYERRPKLGGEKISIHLDKVKLDPDAVGDLYHRPAYFIARPSSAHRGLVQLDDFGGIGCITLTADRDSLRQALEEQRNLAELERADRGGGVLERLADEPGRRGFIEGPVKGRIDYSIEEEDGKIFLVTEGIDVPGLPEPVREEVLSAEAANLMIGERLSGATVTIALLDGQGAGVGWSG